MAVAQRRARPVAGVPARPRSCKRLAIVLRIDLTIANSMATSARDNRSHDGMRLQCDPRTRSA
jgi:hypothetical protein